MLNAKEMATNLLNRSLRLPNNLTHFVRFEEAKEMALLQVMSIKEALYNVSIIDNHICNKSLNYYQNVKKELENLTLKNETND